MKTNFNELSEFSKEFKRFSKKRIVGAVPLGNSKHFNIITQNEQCAVIKARLFCRYLKHSSLRIVYAFYSQDCKIEFIEIYFKGKKKNENRERIKNYLKD